MTAAHRLAAALALLVPTAAAAADMEARLDAARLEAEAMPYPLTVVGVAGARDLHLKAEGDAAALDTLRFERRGDTAVLRAEGAGGEAGGTTIVSNVTTLSTGGNSVQTIIGNTVVTGSGSGKPLPTARLVLEVPADLPVDLAAAAPVTARGLTAFTGTITTGTLTAEDMRDAGVAVAGTGSATVVRPTGGLTLRLLGTGSIAVREADVTALIVELEGVGDVSVCGRAATARIDAAGVGSIAIERVDATPIIEQEGVGSVNVGHC